MHDKPMSREGEGETEVCRLFCMIKIYVKFSCFGHGTKRKSENQKQFQTRNIYTLVAYQPNVHEGQELVNPL